MDAGGFFLQGLGLGIAIAAPVGQIGVLCIRRTLLEGRLYGFASGMGAATADALYGSIAAFGFGAMASLLVSIQTPLRVAGGLFLIFMGLRAMLTRQPQATQTGGRRGLGRAYLSTFLLTLANPSTIIAFASIFAGLGLGIASRGAASVGVLVLGVFVGSAFWWFLLSSFVARVGRAISAGALQKVNLLSGAVIGAFGLFTLWSGLT